MPDQELIADLEAEIDQLHEEIARCRKIDLAAKAVLVGGCATLMIGFLAATPTTLVLAIAAVLGSLALLGSNSRTMAEAVAMLKAQEERRSELIDAMELQVIGSEQVS
jgi:predicted benzoate:H+ symporter BenE